MSQNNTSLLALLVQIAKIDSNLALIAAEEKKCRSSLDARALALSKLKNELQREQQIVKDKKASYQKEEKHLRDEQSKLIDRRKALGSFPSLKLQQAAQKEIENTSRDLSTREEALLTVLDEFEALEKQYNDRLKFEAEETVEIESATREFLEMKTGFDERRKRQHDQREILVAGVDPASMTTYDRVHDKYMMDPVVPLQGKNCGGCFMQLGPQVFVILNKGDALVRCPGCSRIVYLAEVSGVN
jgi:predicted  nucleic acid-binding Zn-ribbon protein